MTAWRKRFAELGIAVHPAADCFPDVTEEDLSELANDIVENGLRHPIILCCDRVKRGRTDYPRQDELVLLDGRTRLSAMELAGISLFEDGRFAPDLLIDGRENPVEIVWRSLGGSVDFDPVAYVISANIHRRHLHFTREQKRGLLAELLKIKTELSDRALARVAKVSDKTVTSVRRELEGRAEIPHVLTRTDAAGRQQPATKPTSSETSAAPQTAPAPLSAEQADRYPKDVVEACKLLGLLNYIATQSAGIDLKAARRGLSPVELDQAWSADMRCTAWFREEVEPALRG